jgi:hypothetical protein
MRVGEKREAWADGAVSKILKLILDLIKKNIHLPSQNKERNAFYREWSYSSAG